MEDKTYSQAELTAELRKRENRHRAEMDALRGKRGGDVRANAGRPDNALTMQFRLVMGLGIAIIIAIVAGGIL